MEELEALLKRYNLEHLEDLCMSPWSRQYCRTPFPKYWYIVYKIMDAIDRDNRVIEIGCGQGDVTTIFCHLGFQSVTSFEKVQALATSAKRRISDLFGRSGVVIQGLFPEREVTACDVLVLVNCAYKDLADSKEEYKQLMMDYYASAGHPRYFLMEVIDSSYTQYDEEFPDYIRLSHEDVEEMFPSFIIQSWPTYTFPENKKSKTLYLIEKA